MEKADHQPTASWGRRKSASQWRTVQEDLIQRGKFGKAMEMDIRDIQRKFENKYNDSMREMIEYANNEGFITNKEARRLKNKYLH